MIKKVAVLLGGTSAERDVSLASGAAVVRALSTLQVPHVAFDTAKRPLHDLVAEGVSHAFIMLHGRGGEDGTVQGALEFMGIPYTGTGVLGSALCMDKVRTKQIWQALGLPTAGYREVRKPLTLSEAEDCLAQLSGMVMVKPSHEGSSIGMAKETTAEGLVTAVAAALLIDNSVLIEAYIKGPEYTVAILGDQALPSIKMATPNEFYDYEAKYQNTTTEYFCPSGLSAEQETQIGNLCLSAFKAVSAEGWGRVDVMQNQQGEFILLEVNTVPGMTEKSLVPKAAAQAGLDFAQLVSTIIMQAFHVDIQNTGNAK
jgi:D-alanine-D-alanine ligase